MNNNKFEGISAIKELNDEFAATYSGGAATTGGTNPDIILYNGPGFPITTTTSDLTINEATNDGLFDLRNTAIGTQTGSAVIIRGTWAAYDSNQNLLGTVAPGEYNSVSSSAAGKIAYVQRVSAT